MDSFQRLIGSLFITIGLLLPNAGGAIQAQTSVAEPLRTTTVLSARDASGQKADSLYVASDYYGETAEKLSLKMDFMFALSGSFGGDYAPFWFTSNRQGYSVVSDADFVEWCGISGVYRFNHDWRLNMDVRVGINDNLGNVSAINLPVYYSAVDYRWLRLSVGAEERWDETLNARLSSGGLTWSGNALPVPQVRLEVPQYKRLGILGGWFSLKGHVAYGRYLDDGYRRLMHDKADGGLGDNSKIWSDGILYHSKSAFLHIGDRERFPLEATWGLEMCSQFGGTVYNNSSFNAFGAYRLPSGPKAYWQALLPFNAAGEQGRENGNILGSWHIYMDYYPGKWKIRAYWEHYYEDHSSMLGTEYKKNSDGKEGFVAYGYKRNWFDALFGLQIDAPKGLPFSSIVLEYMNTRGQCGSLCNFWPELAPEGVDGDDNMYNHSIYQSYSYFGYAMGSAVLVSPLYTDENGDLRFPGNRVRMWHIGIEGDICSFGYRLLATNSSHWGTYRAPFDKVEHITSILAELGYRTKKHKNYFSLSYGQDWDSGQRLGSKSGVMFTFHGQIKLR